MKFRACCTEIVQLLKSKIFLIYSLTQNTLRNCIVFNPNENDNRILNRDKENNKIIVWRWNIYVMILLYIHYSTSGIKSLKFGQVLYYPLIRQ